MTVSIDDIKKARENLEDQIHLTPVYHSRFLSKISGANIYLKAENLQKTGSFKIRGAFNTVKNAIASRGKVKGFVTGSSGNHGQAVAYSATMAGVPATVVLPRDASKAKVNAIRDYGAKTVYVDPPMERLVLAERMAKEENLVFIPSYDHKDVISGQGTLGMEILEQIPSVDIVVVPVGGGGLVSGVLVAIKELNPKVKVIGVEAIKSNSMYLSLQAGHILSLDTIDTIADGARTKQPGKITFDIVQRYIDEIMLVEEEDIVHAMYLLMERQKIVVEPTGALSLAAALKGRFEGKNVVSILSGGNVEMLQLGKLLINYA